MRFHSLALCTLLATSLSACGGVGTGTPIPQPSASTSPSADHYQFPLQLSQQLECGGGEQLIYAVNSQGEFRFRTSEEGADPVFATHMLSSTERQELDALLEKSDFDALQQGGTVIPEDAPQTRECRAVDTLAIQHDGQSETYARNGRTRRQSEAFQNAWTALRTRLDALKAKYSAASPSPAPSAFPTAAPAASYALPLKVQAEGECGLPSYTRYEVLADGTFRYTLPQADLTENAAPPTQSRSLSAAEKQALEQLLASADLAAKAAADTPVPDDAPQTMECRTVSIVSLEVSGQTRSFDANSRKLQHSEAYRQAMQQLLEKLETLTTAPPSTELYTLPLKVSLVGECGLPSFTRYEVTADGRFTWTREDWPTLVAGNPPIESRQLSTTERNRILAAVKALDPLTQASHSEAVPADAPQTKECRTVTLYHFTSKGQSTSFEGEGTRKFRHSQALLDGLSDLQKLLFELSGQKPA
ncbi:MAG: hypothetical protein ACO1RX_11900 [Candidatus Sericytochromatia bacterium]